jgi:hypothetical protein
MRSNIRFEFARCARPTRKSEALLLAAQAGRWDLREQMTSERPLDSDEISAFERYRETGLQLLGASEADAAKALVHAVNTYVDEWQSRRRGFLARLRARAEDTTEVARALSVVWGDQIVRHFGWEWICEVKDEEEWYAVASTDRSLVIHPPRFIGQCLDEPKTDCTILLAFNMQSAGNFTGCKPKQYVNVMSGVRRVVPKR